MTEDKGRRSSLIDTVSGGVPSHKWRAAILAAALAAMICAAPLSQPIAQAAPRAATSSKAGSPAADQDTYTEVAQDKGYRFDRGGWIYVHLEGSPHDIGYQHGYLLATEITDAFAVVRLEDTHNTGRDWDFFRRAAREMLWPKIDPEYQAELQGIVDGLQANKTKLALDDIVA